MQSYPLIFKFSRPVKTDNYHVAVSAQGRILMKPEFGKWWVYGVAPGGLAESGETPNEAYLNYMNSFWGVIHDISCDNSDYHSFIQEVNVFIKAINEGEEKEWEEARSCIRDGQLKETDPFSSLPKETRESYARALFDRLDTEEKRQNQALEPKKYNNDELLIANTNAA